MSGRDWALDHETRVGVVHAIRDDRERCPGDLGSPGEPGERLWAGNVRVGVEGMGRAVVKSIFGERGGEVIIPRRSGVRVLA